MGSKWRNFAGKWISDGSGWYFVVKTIAKKSNRAKSVERNEKLKDRLYKLIMETGSGWACKNGERASVGREIERL